MTLAPLFRALPILPLAACVSGAGNDLDRMGAAMAAPGITVVSLDGADFTAEMRAGPPGTELTAAGARPVAGNTLAITRSPALAMDEGALAKRAARQGCADLGGRFNETALGDFQAGGAWVFLGGCA